MRSWGLVVLALAACGDDGGTSAVDAAPKPIDAAPVGPFSIMATKVGTPTWKVSEAQQFTGTIGSMATGYAEAPAAVRGLLPEHVQDTTGLWASSMPHTPSATELADGVAAAGVTPASSFAKSAWTPPAGIFVVVVVSADATAPVGQTSDGMFPMIASSAFPINEDWDLVRSGAVVDANFDALDTFTAIGGGSNAGISHFPFFLGESGEFLNANEQTGTFEWRGKLRDAQNNGWDVVLGPLEVH